MKGEDKDAKNFFTNNNFNKAQKVKHREKLSGQYDLLLSKMGSAHAAPGHSPFDDKFEIKDIELALKHTKKHTTPGKSGISIDAITAASPVLLHHLLSLFNLWWKTGYIPEQMQIAVIKPIYKKGDVNEPKNYRPISLLEVIFKLYEKLLEVRLRDFVEQKKCITHLQMGSRAKMGTTEALFQMMSTVHTNKATLGLLDLSKAYDRVWRKGLWVKLDRIGVSGNLMRALHSTYSHPSAEIKIGDKTSKKYNLTDGVRQGSVLSPILFVILFSEITEVLHKNLGVKLPNNHTVHCQLFVDDSILVANSLPNLLRQINNFNNYAFLSGSVINIDKTQILSLENAESVKEELRQLNLPEEVDTIAKYLGVWITLKNHTWNQHYNKIIANARRAYFDLRRLGVRNESLNLEEAIYLIEILILPKLLFAAEVLTPSDAVINKVDKFLARMVKLLLDLPEKKFGDPKTILWEANLPDFRTMLEKAKLRFHHKLSNNTGFLGSIYQQGNYLFELNSSILKKWFQKSPPLTCNTSKFQWASCIKKRAPQVRMDMMISQAPSFLRLKPHAPLANPLLRLRNSDRSSVLWARHFSADQECGCKKQIYTTLHVLHVLTECKHIDNIIFKLNLFRDIWNMMPQLQNFDTEKLALATMGNPLNFKFNDFKKIITLSAEAFTSLKADLNITPEFCFQN